jgi:type 1 glutamine amidotransferase
MLPRLSFATALLASLVLVNLAPAQHKVPRGVNALILSGGQRDHHAYRRQTYRLQKLLEDTRQFQVTVCEDAAVLETPALQKYGLIVAMADRRDPEFRLTEGQQRGLLSFVREGKGFFSLHGFCCADRSWLPEMRELEGGVLAHFGTLDTRVKLGHFAVKIANHDHPITRGLTDFEHDDELYYYLQTTGELKPLVTAVCEGKEWPIMWTRSFGQGKACVSVFGHCGIQAQSKDPLDDPPFQQLVLRGIAWVAGRELK